MSSVVTGDSDRSKRELSVRESGINSGGAYAAMARGSTDESLHFLRRYPGCAPPGQHFLLPPPCPRCDAARIMNSPHRLLTQYYEYRLNITTDVIFDMFTNSFFILHFEKFYIHRACMCVL